MRYERFESAVRVSGYGPLPGSVATIALTVVAVVLWFDPWPYEPPMAATPPLAASVTDPATVRAAGMSLKLKAVGFGYNCSECHDLLRAPDEPAEHSFQHKDIVMAHGFSNRCFNCHHREKRDYFVDYDGSAFDSTDTVKLCRKCHGPVYRDWTHRVHGRTNGYWDPAMGEQRVQPCIACHDPHSPAFAAMPPAPGPHTYRMGKQVVPHEEHDATETNPLLHWNRRGKADRAAGRDHPGGEKGAER